jgi:hypothetical protein
MQKSPEFLLEKIKTQPHPWFGTINLYSCRKTKLAEFVILSDNEKSKLYPSPSWADNRVVKMCRAQLQQALLGNFMLPGEEELRLTLPLNTASHYPRD